MIVNVRDNARLKALCQRLGYRKHKVILEDHNEITLTGGYWDGGSRSSYSILALDTGDLEPVYVSRDPKMFGGAPPPTHNLSSGLDVIITTGVFCGKAATMSITGPRAIEYFGPQ